MKKTLLTILCTVLVCSCVMGATLAYLADKTDPIENTFTVGNIDIELTETKGEGTALAKSFKMIPGSTIDKDPTVTVKANSEACYVFVKIDEANGFDTYMTFDAVTGWTKLSENNEKTSSVYYREVAASNGDQTFYVLSGGTDNHGSVKVLDTVTKIDGTNPTLTFTAYAIQTEGFDEAADAWTEVSKLG